MLGVADKIIKVQKELVKLYGYSGYKRMISAMKKRIKKVQEALEKQGFKISELEYLNYVAKDDTEIPEVRLLAIACMGE